MLTRKITVIIKKVTQTSQKAINQAAMDTDMVDA
jgi:hypothetical protein